MPSIKPLYPYLHIPLYPPSERQYTLTPKITLPKRTRFVSQLRNFVINTPDLYEIRAKRIGKPPFPTISRGRVSLLEIEVSDTTISRSEYQVPQYQTLDPNL